MKVKDLMTPEPITVPPDITIEALVQLLAERHISGVFVTDPWGVPLGVVTEADLIRRLAPEGEGNLGWLARLLVSADRAAEDYVRTHGTRARDVMTASVAAVAEDAPATDAARMMQELKVRRVAVLRDGRLVGVVSRADLLKAVATRPDALGTGTAYERIQRTIISEMRMQPWANTHFTTVVVKDGAIRLEGYCRSEEARQALRVLAERVEGVRHVEDDLQIERFRPPESYPTFPAV